MPREASSRCSSEHPRMGRRVDRTGGMPACELRRPLLLLLAQHSFTGVPFIHSFVIHNGLATMAIILLPPPVNLASSLCNYLVYIRSPGAATSSDVVCKLYTVETNKRNIYIYIEKARTRRAFVWVGVYQKQGGLFSTYKIC